MNNLQAEIEPVLELLRYHVPAGWTGHGVLAAAVAGGLGLMLAIWGARLLRVLLVLGFAGAGAWGGMAANEWLGLGHWFCVISGGLVFGALGLVLYRLWVGAAWAALLTCAALSVLGYQQVWPRWGEFSESRVSAAVLTDGTFTPPTVEQQAQFTSPDPAQIFREFGDDLVTNVPNIKRNALLICGITALGGLLMGVLAVRFTMILASALAGVALLSTAVGYGLARFRPQAMEQIAQHPAAVLAGVGVAVLLSMGIQWFQAAGSQAPGRSGPAAGRSRST